MKTNNHPHKQLFTLLVATLVGLINSTVAQPSFQGLGDLPGGAIESAALGVSADGKTVVGFSASSNGVEAIIWTNGIMTGLGDLPGGSIDSVARAVSADGSVIIGQGDSGQGYKAFRWEGGTMTDLGVLPGYTRSVALGLSRDGSVIAGNVFGANGEIQAYRWANGVMTGLGDLPGGFFDSAVEFGPVSADGSVIVGRSSSLLSDHYEAFRWQSGNMSALGYLAGGRSYSDAFAVSADGTIIVGQSSSARSSQQPDEGEACRWDNGVVSALGDLAGGAFESIAYAVSDDGQVIVGRGTTDQGVAAFIWDATNGMRNLQQVLAGFCGTDLSGWKLSYAFGISADGTTIVGRGLHNGNTEGWVARIPREVVLNGETPSLDIQQSVTLSWPVCHTGYQVQASPSLAEPDWQFIDPPVSVSGNKNVVTVLVTPAQKYFRLVKP